jgi:hypothetical protein
MRMAGKTHGEKRGKKWKPLMSAIDILCVYVSVCLCVCVPYPQLLGKALHELKGENKIKPYVGYLHPLPAAAREGS